jgi:hypothetical protein
VRQDTFGRLPDVPVPRKMNSMPGETRTDSERIGLVDIVGLRLDISVDRKRSPRLPGFKKPHK